MSQTPTISAESVGVVEKEFSPSSEEVEYPEGGLQGWLAVAGSFLVYFASFGFINSFGTFQVGG